MPDGSGTGVPPPDDEDPPPVLVDPPLPDEPHPELPHPELPQPELPQPELPQVAWAGEPAAKVMVARPARMAHFISFTRYLPFGSKEFDIGYARPLPDWSDQQFSEEQIG